MRANRNIIYASVIVGLISGVLLIVLQHIELCVAIFSAIFTGCIVGLIIPVINFYTIKKQEEISFYTICINRLNSIKQIANWFSWQEGELKYEYLDELRSQNMMEEYFKKSDAMEKKAKEGFNLIYSYSYADTTRFYEIIDDYCGLLKNHTEIKKTMLEIRDYFNKFSICYQPIQILECATLQRQKFSGWYCKQYFFAPYKHYTAINDNGVEAVNGKMEQYLNLSKIKAYTQKVQR